MSRDSARGGLLVVIAVTAAGLGAIILLHRNHLDGSSPGVVLEPADRPLRTGFRAQDYSIDDGLFEIREIRRLHLRVRLVTLSSCDAGVGPIEESGVADLVNAFSGRRNVSSRPEAQRCAISSIPSFLFMQCQKSP